MSRFAETLREIAGRLSLPQPARSRLLLEIAGDLEDLYAHYRDEGLSDDEARRRALEGMDLSDEALAELAQVHGGLLRRVLDRIPGELLGRFEHGLLTLVLLFAAVASLGLSRHELLLAAAGPYVWPVLLAALAALGLILSKAYMLFIKRDHEPRRLRRGLAELPVLAGAQIFLGFMGGWAEALRLSLTVGSDPAARIRSLLDWTLEASALLQVALSLALLTGLAWFFLAGRVARAERAEAELLLTERGTP